MGSGVQAKDALQRERLPPGVERCPLGELPMCRDSNPLSLGVLTPLF